MPEESFTVSYDHVAKQLTLARGNVCIKMGAENTLEALRLAEAEVRKWRLHTEIDQLSKP